MRRRCLALAATLVLAGCKTYDPKPLVPKDELAALARVDLTAFKVEREKPGQQGPPTLRFDVTDGLNEPEVVAIALTLNPSIRAFRYGSVEARSHLVTAGLWPNPVFAFSWQPGVAGGPGVSADAVWLIEIIRVWERSARIDAAEAAAKRTEAEIVAAEWRLVADVRSKLWAVLAGEQSLAILTEELALRRRTHELTLKGKALGETRELEVAFAELEVAEIERDIRRAQTELETARRELNRVMGLPPTLATPLSELKKPLTFTVYEDLSAEELDQRTLTGRFELRAKEFGYEESEHEHRLAIHRQFPPLGVGPSYSRQPENTHYVGPAFLVELPIFNQNQGEIAESEAARERVRVEYTALLHALRADAHEALGQLRRAKLEVEAQERSVLPVIERTQKLLELGLKRREVSTLEWITAQRRALQARREYIATLTRYQEAVIRVETTTGLPLARSAPR